MVPTPPWVTGQEPVAALAAAARWGWLGCLHPPCLLPQITPCLKGNQVAWLPTRHRDHMATQGDLGRQKNPSGLGRFLRSHTDAKKERKRESERERKRERKKIYIYTYRER